MTDSTMEDRLFYFTEPTVEWGLVLDESGSTDIGLEEEYARTMADKHPVQLVKITIEPVTVGQKPLSEQDADQILDKIARIIYPGAYSTEEEIRADATEVYRDADTVDAAVTVGLQNLAERHAVVWEDIEKLRPIIEALLTDRRP